MPQRQVRLFGDPVLKSRADEITAVDASIRALADDMLTTMDAYGGVGLAANQIGVLKRIFVYDCTSDSDDEPVRGAVINPEWEALDEDTMIGDEGCLSIPGIHKEVERSARIRCRGLGLDGEPVEFEATGLLARCVQHETDHLDGVLFLDRITPQLRKEALREIRESDWF